MPRERQDEEKSRNSDEFRDFMLRAMPVLRETVRLELERKRLFGFPITPVDSPERDSS